MTQPLKQARLGRGLSALLGDYAGARDAIESGNVMGPETPSTEDLTPSEIAIDRIVPNPKQPRRTFIEAELEELAESIRTKGVIQPILVRPVGGEYEVVCGQLCGAGHYSMRGLLVVDSPEDYEAWVREKPSS